MVQGCAACRAGAYLSVAELQVEWATSDNFGQPRFSRIISARWSECDGSATRQDIPDC